VTITAIHRYPVKSMLGESLQEAVIGPRGIAGDRAYAVLDVETGIVASAKVPRRWAGLLGFTASYIAEPAPDGPPSPVAITFPDGQVCRSDDPSVDERLSTALGRQVRLVTEAPADSGFEELWPDIDGLAPQAVIDATTTRHEESGEVISRLGLSMFGAPGTFFDLSALHLITTSTLDRLQVLAPDSAFDVRRYRPNLVLSGPDEGFVENGWPGSTAVVGSARIGFSFPTMRCVMTTLAQQDLPDDRATLRTVAKHNRIDIPQLGGRWACAGVYADVVAPGRVAVGDAVEHLPG
jgi:uncharacterized protein YcbX